MSRSLAVLTSGGDAPGMNAGLRAIAKVGAARGLQVVGVRDGYDGLIDGRFEPLTRPGPGAKGWVVEDRVEEGAGRGGTWLGSARCARFREAEGRAQAAARIEGFAGLIVLGGDGSLTGAELLSKLTPTPVIGMPASIDNDIGCTALSIGVDTALNTIVEACDRISDTASSHHRAFIVEVMGRHSGYLAMASAITAGADGALLREQGRSEEQVVDALVSAIQGAFARGRKRVLLLKAEGVTIPCTRLVRLAEARLPGVEIRGTVLGHLVRGGAPSHMDRMIASRLGLAAVEAVLAGATGEMVAWQPTAAGGVRTGDPMVGRYPISRVLEESKALLDGSSAVTRWRVRMMEELEGVLGV